MSLSKATSQRRKLVPEECLDAVLASCCTISRLSDDALLHIFAYFPLHQILTIFRRVCTRWNSAVFTFCATKRSLALFTSPNPIAFFGLELSLLTPQHYARLRLRHIGHDSDLIIGAKFSARTCAHFHSLFPRIECLLIEESKNIFLPHLARLLSGWPTLHTFSLYGALPSRSGALQHSQLYQALGRQSQLKHLDLLVDGLLGVSASRKVMAPILARLETFSCRAEKSRVKEYFLGDLGPACTSLRLDGLTIGDTLPSYMAPGVFRTVTSLSIIGTPLISRQVTLLVEAFPALTAFTLDWGTWKQGGFKLEPNPTLERFVAPLSALSSLENVRLRVPYEIFIGTLIHQQFGPPSPYTCQSVRYLNLQVHVSSNLYLAWLDNPFVFAYLVGAFPNLATFNFFPLLEKKRSFSYCVEGARRQCREVIGPKVREYLGERLWPKGELRVLEVGESGEGLGRHKEAYLAGKDRFGVQQSEAISEAELQSLLKGEY